MIFFSLTIINDIDEFSMENKPRGTCLVLNNYLFTPNIYEKELKGWKIDLQLSTQMFHFWYTRT